MPIKRMFTVNGRYEVLTQGLPGGDKIVITKNLDNEELEVQYLPLMVYRDIYGNAFEESKDEISDMEFSSALLRAVSFITRKCSEATRREF
ncbi:MAG: hypothetical protein NW226_17660 [Microscillaceae bacterium]|nr:hypothetical protein [Microscillaceae bacterium]